MRLRRPLSLQIESRAPPRAVFDSRTKAHQGKEDKGAAGIRRMRRLTLLWVMLSLRRHTFLWFKLGKPTPRADPARV